VDDFHGVTAECGTDFTKGFLTSISTSSVDITTLTQAYFAQLFANESSKSILRDTHPPAACRAFMVTQLWLEQGGLSGNQVRHIFGMRYPGKGQRRGISRTGVCRTTAAFNVAVTNGTIAYAAQLRGVQIILRNPVSRHVTYA
jgi:hypothetical protein